VPQPLAGKRFFVKRCTGRCARLARPIISQLTVFATALIRRQVRPRRIKKWVRFPRVKSRNRARIRTNTMIF
jgi:hypothetical protein